jgi:hypothetical protein
VKINDTLLVINRSIREEYIYSAFWKIIVNIFLIKTIIIRIKWKAAITPNRGRIDMLMKRI